MAVSASQNTVGVSASVLVDPSAVDPRRIDSTLIHNKGSVSIYIGGTNSVTTASGYEIAPGEALSLADLGDTDKVYAISGTAGQRVDVLRVGV